LTSNARLVKAAKLSSNPASVWQQPWHFLAFGFGVGTVPWAPGTWGTLVAIPFCLLFSKLSLGAHAAVLVAMILVGVYLCGKTARDLAVYDHSGIVWDEIVGFCLSMVAIPITWWTVSLGFVLFRLFDIAKPWPIWWFERHVPGGLGIMLDDILAAVYTWICLRAWLYWLN
jgi:phosphatidylglycerophosphatase A